MRRFRTIVADNPWRFRDEGRRGGTRGHYETMGLSELVALGPWVQRVATPDAHLYLWVPNSFLVDAVVEEGGGFRAVPPPWAHVAAAWGFRPVQPWTWVKSSLKFGTGTYFRNTTEAVVFAVGPACRPSVHRRAKNLRTHAYWPRSEHSAKPSEFAREVVEKMSGGPYLELFARHARTSWTCVGNEVAGMEGVGVADWLRRAGDKIDATERAA